MINKKQRKRRIIFADRESGLEAVPFAVSIVAHVIKVGNKRVKFKFPFWAFSIPAGTSSGTEWISNKGYETEAIKILKYIKKPEGLNYFNKIEKQITKEEKILEKIARQVCCKLSVFTDKELVRTYEKFMEQYSYYYGLGILTFLYEEILSKKLIDSLVLRYPAIVNNLDYLLKGSYSSFMFKSERALIKISQERKEISRQKLINKYKENFFYIRSNYWHSPLVDDKFIFGRLKHLKKAEEDKISHFKLKLMPWETQVVSLFKISEAIHDKRKQINMIGSYTMFRFIEELSVRRKIQLTLAKRAYWFEFRDLLMNTQLVLARLKKRQEVCIGYENKKDFYFDYLAVKEKKNEVFNRKEFNGVPASPGLYKGLVRLVLTRKDLEDFKNKEILVAAMTRPEFFPVMKKAGAIITDEGGLTCHAAIIARELKKPCIIGTKNATNFLCNGDEIEVNANKGIIKIIKRK